MKAHMENIRSVNTQNSIIFDNTQIVASTCAGSVEQTTQEMFRFHPGVQSILIWSLLGQVQIGNDSNLLINLFVILE